MTRIAGHSALFHPLPRQLPGLSAIAPEGRRYSDAGAAGGAS